MDEDYWLNYSVDDNGGKMFNKDRHILRIDDDYYKVFEIMDKYEVDGLVFPETNTRTVSKKKRTHDVLKAISLGIPFQNIYLCELHSGQLLVMDSTEKLKCLIEFLCKERYVSLDEEMFYASEFDEVSIDDMYPEVRQTILRTVVPAKIIRYDTPAYLQMFIGNYTQDFSITNMEYIRRIIYSRVGMYEVMRAIQDNGGRNTYLNIEYEFIVFLTYVVSFHYVKGIKDEAGQYYLEENMLYWIDGKQELVNELFMIFAGAKRDILRGYRDYNDSISLGRIRLFERKYPVFQPVFGHILGIAAASCGTKKIMKEQILAKIRMLVYENKRSTCDGDLQELLDVCDLSFGALKRIVNYLV